MLNLEEEILIERANYLLEEINKSEQSSDPGPVDLSLKDYQRIINRIEEIKNNRFK